MKAFVAGVNLNVCEHHGRSLWTPTAFKNGVEVHGQFMADHALRGGNPSVEVLCLTVIHGEEVADLRSVAVGDDHPPVHLEQIDDVAHDPRQDLGGLITVPGRRLKGVATQGIDRCLAHEGTSFRTVLTLCPIW